MKKKLLITIGDSFTEGVGCYDPVLLEKYIKNEITMEDMYIPSQPRYKQYAWPTYVAKNLNYDLINLATGGMANSAMAKTLIKNQFDNLLEKYQNVIVILMLSDPGRISFYKQGQVSSIIPNTDVPDDLELYQHYLKFINLPEVDFVMETAFYVKAIESFCRANQYNFIYGSFVWNIEEMSMFYNTNQNIHKYLYKEAPRSLIQLLGKNNNFYAVCGHPNESGHKLIGNKITKVLLRNFTEIL